jgi:hypothetical protein
MKTRNLNSKMRLKIYRICSVLSRSSHLLWVGSVAYANCSKICFTILISHLFLFYYKTRIYFIFLCFKWSGNPLKLNSYITVRSRVIMSGLTISAFVIELGLLNRHTFIFTTTFFFFFNSFYVVYFILWLNYIFYWT